MPHATLKSGHKLHYDEFGDPNGEAFVLVMGLNTQSIAWMNEFCTQLTQDNKYRVIRFDNRDIGLSDKFETPEKYNIMAAYLRHTLHMNVNAPYTLEDMASDVFGLMDCLNIEKAHIVGASMGGMIVQVCALQNQSRVLSMTSIMSSTGARGLPSAKFSLIKLLIKPKPTNPQELHKWMLRFYQAVVHPSNWNAELASQIITSFNDRSIYDDKGRQLLAILSAPPRSKTLKNIKVPSLVIHGAYDPLLPVAHGIATHKAIPGSTFLKIDTMGHSLPMEHWDSIIQHIHEVAAQGSSAVNGGSEALPVGVVEKPRPNTEDGVSEAHNEDKLVQNAKIEVQVSEDSMPDDVERTAVTA